MIDRLKQRIVRVVKRVVVVEDVACLQALELILHCFTMPINWLRLSVMGPWYNIWSIETENLARFKIGNK